MRKILNTLAALALMVLPMAMASCSDNTGESDDAEFANWRNRNAAFYDSLLAVARTDVAQAKAAHPDNWQAYTPWRLLPSFSKPFASQSTDTVVALGILLTVDFAIAEHLAHHFGGKGVHTTHTHAVQTA